MLCALAMSIAHLGMPTSESLCRYQVGKLISFLGSTAALGLMTVISVSIGYCFKSVPDALKSSVPIGQYLSVACMLYFGVRTIKVILLRHSPPSSSFRHSSAAVSGTSQLRVTMCCS